jgi:hypothetical protein
MIAETDTDTAYRMRELRAELERRIEILERLQGRQGMARWLGPLLGVVALFLAVLVGARTSDAHHLGTVAPSLEAQTFVLKDVDGVERAKLALGEDGGPSLTLTDASGRARLRLAVLSDGSPGVSLLDTDGESRAILGLLPDGTTTLVFADRGSVARGVFAITPDGAARMIFNDANGVTRTAVGVDGTGESEISTISVESDGEGG